LLLKPTDFLLLCEFNTVISRLATTNYTGTMTNYLFDYMEEVYGWLEFPAYLGLTFVFLSAGLMEEGKNFMRFQRLSDMVIASVMD
jgi:hypothetical protein